jgi:hypothetical protein
MSAKLSTSVAATLACAVTLPLAGVAQAEPAPTLPIDGFQAPGLSAVQGLAPAIQQAAADPTNAASTLMAAAAVFAGDAAAPAESRNVATAVNQFVAHTPAPGAVPGAQAHLPAGVNPRYAVGPVPAPDAHIAGEPAAPGPAAPTPPAEPQAAPAPEAPAAPEAATPPGLTFGPDAPPVQEFMYPSISNNCLADGGNVLATAISVAGPADIPTPGPGPGQTAYVFTAIGTPGPAPEQKLPLNVTWVNLTTGKSGTATLTPRPDINPDGPTTLTAIVDTGSGSIISTIFGQVTTVEKQCQFMPTIGSTVVP